MASRQRRHPLFRSSRPSSPPWSRRRWNCPVVPMTHLREQDELPSRRAVPGTVLVTVKLPPALRRSAARVERDIDWPA